jgi:hypothetical protein
MTCRRVVELASHNICRVDELIRGDHRMRDDNTPSYPPVKAVWWQLVTSLATQRSVLVGCHECWEPHTKKHGKQQPQIFCKNMTIEVRASCRRFSRQMKPGSTIPNPNPSDNRRISAIRHPQGRRNLRTNRQQENSWLQSLGIRKVLLLLTYFLGWQ